MSEVSSRIKRLLVNGIAVTIPLIVTLIVLVVVVEFTLSLLSPMVAVIAFFWVNEPPAAVLQIGTVISLVGFVLLVGVAAEYTSGRELSRRFHETVETIPGVGTLYTSIRQASNVLVNDDIDQFQEVKLVEFPYHDSYVLGFLTAETPTAIEESADAGEMQTIMIPLGPNPTTNGFILYIPTENVHDVDVTVKEAVGIIATLGVTSDRVDPES